jgi:hypothetical protein
MQDDKPPKATVVTLRALQGRPLEQEPVREMVLATARAIAERQGVTVLEVRAEPASITVTLAATRIVAIGFAAELRRLTTTWYTRKYGEESLWGQPADRPDGKADDEAGDWWKS